jgi:hypothetical protein
VPGTVVQPNRLNARAKKTATLVITTFSLIFGP